MTFGHVSRRARQKMPPYHSMWSTPTIRISSVGPTSRSFLDDIERIAPPCLAEWSLTSNGSKTERTCISRHVDRIEEEWRMTRKLGSLLGEAEDVARRKQLANVAFRKLWTVWFRRTHISLQLRLRLYASFVIPVLTYNMGTWGLLHRPTWFALTLTTVAIFARSSVSTGDAVE